VNTATGREQRYSPAGDRMTSIADAMEHFGLGSKVQGPKSGLIPEKVHVVAEVRRLTIKTQFVRVVDPKTQERTGEFEWFREQVDTQYFKDDMALVGIPRAYVGQFGIEAFVLTEEQERHFRERVADRASGKSF
jgi:hypothetical protein